MMQLTLELPRYGMVCLVHNREQPSTITPQTTCYGARCSAYRWAAAHAPQSNQCRAQSTSQLTPPTTLTDNQPTTSNNHPNHLNRLTRFSAISSPMKPPPTMTACLTLCFSIHSSTARLHARGMEHPLSMCNACQNHVVKHPVSMRVMWQELSMSVLSTPEWQCVFSQQPVYCGHSRCFPCDCIR